MAPTAVNTDTQAPRTLLDWLDEDPVVRNAFDGPLDQGPEGEETFAVVYKDVAQAIGHRVLAALKRGEKLADVLDKMFQANGMFVPEAEGDATLLRRRYLRVRELLEHALRAEVILPDGSRRIAERFVSGLPS